MVKCRTVTRLPYDEKWNAKQVLRMRGKPWEPIHGKKDRRIPVAIDLQGNGVQADEDEVEVEATHDHSEDEGVEHQFKSGTDKFHVSRKAIDKYGPTQGCPACTTIVRRGITIGRVGVHHNQTCRERITKAMKQDPQYRQLMQKHQENVSMLQEQTALEEQQGHLRKVTHAFQQDIKKREREQHRRSVGPGYDEDNGGTNERGRIL